MGVNFQKFSHCVLFLVFLPALSVGLAWGLNAAALKSVPSGFAFLVDSLGLLGAYGVLYKLFDLWLWRLRILRILGIVEAPDLSGRWVGIIQSSHDGGAKEHEAALEIRQTFSAVKVAMYFPESSSVSVIEGFARESDGAMGLHYEYQNVPAIDAPETMHIHYGAAKLRFSNDERQILGSYYNWGRDNRGHVGTVDVRFVGKRLLYRLR